ncbi:Cu/Ag efflux protein CusF [Hydrogenophaga palleronii]|uniref:Cu/Ag efflux protein CusF n=1 Tax=Hydrogenophaga palleronii TaxID=65655 RepID=A0ABU1WV86_9BURK|nr:copper-binding protein [Hydrogenophaga palleronii]MDR7153089.1 Cu/Ag efflux protein CusF [Hydrogenophaga palleronii]
MKHPLLALAFLLTATTLPAMAQTTDHASHHTTAPAAAPADALPLAEAEVRRIDTAANKVSLKHGEIKNLDMPPMTMVFQVSDPALLGKIKVGDKVRFTAAQVNGAYTVMSLEPAP